MNTITTMFRKGTVQYGVLAVAATIIAVFAVSPSLPNVTSSVGLDLTAQVASATNSEPTPPSCPLSERTGRTIVRFNSSKQLYSKLADWDGGNKETPHVSVNLPAGTYGVTLVSWDGYNGRESISQPNERWNAVVANGSTVVAKSGISGDVPDYKREAMWQGQTDTALVVSQDGTKVYGEHSFFNDTSSYNSVVPICVAFDRIDEEPKTPACPIPQKSGRIIVNFGNDRLLSGGQKETVHKNVSIPVGTYEVTLASWDGYVGREKVTQAHEQWQAVIANGSTVVTTSNASQDVADYVRESLRTDTVNNSLVVSTAGTKVYGTHAFYNDSSSPNSVVPICVAFDPKDEPKVSCDVFGAAPNSFVGSGTTVLKWETTNATNVSIDNGIGAVSADGVKSVFVDSSKTFTLTASNGVDTVTCTAPVTVTPVTPKPSCDLFTATPNSLVEPGGDVTLKWETTNATNVSIDNGVGTVAADGSKVVPVTTDTTFTLTATVGSEKVTCTAPVVVLPVTPEPPACPIGQKEGRVIVDFTPRVRLISGVFGETPTKNVSLPAGSYTVTLASWDGYIGRESVTQPREQWLVTLLNGSTIVGASNAGGDVADYVRQSLRTDVVNDTLVLTSPVTAVYGQHAFYNDTSSPNSVVPICVAFDLKEKPKPSCDLFTAAPNSFVGSGTTTLTWATTNATDVTIDQGVGVVSADGNTSVFVADSKTFTLTASNGVDTVTCAAPVTVTPPKVLSCDLFTAAPNSFVGSGTTTLTWATSNVTSVTIDQGVGTVSEDGSKAVFIDASKTFTLTATDGAKTVQCTAPVTVEDEPELSCDSFTASPNIFSSNGGTTTLAWQTSNATNVSIDNGVGTVAVDGTKDVFVNADTTFTLTASKGANSITCKAPVTVEPPQNGPRCDSLTATPTLFTNAPANVTLTWETTNATDVTINGLGSVSADGSQTISVNGSETFTLTASNTTGSDTCQVNVTYDPPGGGGGSSSPYCRFKVSDDKIQINQEVVLSWDNDRTNDIVIKDGDGNIIVDTDVDLDIDEDEDSIKITPKGDTEYILIAKRGSRERTCRVDVEVEDDVTLTSVREQNPLVGTITLTSIPYTGFDAGPTLTVLFYSLLVLWGLGVAYILVVKGDSVLGMQLRNKKVAAGPNFVAPAVMHREAVVPTTPVAAKEEPSVAKVVGYEAYVAQKNDRA